MTAATVKTLRALENNQVSPNRSREGYGYVAQGHNHGGSRKGAGRKPGALTKKTRETAEAIITDGGITPLDYLISVMRSTDEDLKRQYQRGEIDEVEYAVRLKMQIQRRDNAAEKAAPYVHPKLSSVQANINTDEQARWVDLLNECDQLA